MKILKTTVAGGQPLRRQDLGLIQDNVKLITSAIANGLAFGNTAVVLYGADITLANLETATANYSVSAGAIWYQDEVYIVNEQLAVALASDIDQSEFNSSYYWNVLSTASRNLLFLNGVANNVAEDRTMLLSTNNSGILASTTKNVKDTILSILTASFSDANNGVETEKYITPYVLGRQGENFTVTYPGTVSGTTYQADRYVNGYRSSVFIDAVFTVGGTPQKYIELVLPFPLILYGFVGGVFNIGCVESKTSFWESYITLLGVMTNQGSTTTLRLSKPYNGSSLIADSLADPNPTFTAGASYRFTLNFNK